MRSDREKALLAAVDRNELVRLTQDLVRIDSVIRPESGGTEGEVVRFIADWIRRELGIEPLVEEVVPGRENIIATLDSGSPGPCLMLEGHTDVVSEGERSRWTRDPFGGEVADGKIYGRGSCDMKAGLAVALLTAAAFKRAGVPWQGKIRLGIVCDEEGMMLGIKHYIRAGHADDVGACPGLVPPAIILGGPPPGPPPRGPLCSASLSSWTLTRLLGSSPDRLTNRSYMGFI
jgi:succinyl-diaminopimelate desuccinylase